MAGFASGKHSVAICDRSGFKYPYSEIVSEPGTNLRVHYTESDGMWNMVDHPQNYSPKNNRERIGLRFPRPDVAVGDD